MNHQTTTTPAEDAQNIWNETAKAGDLVWELESSLFLLNAAIDCRGKYKETSEALNAIEFFIYLWLDEYRPKIKALKKAIIKTDEQLRECKKAMKGNP